MKNFLLSSIALILLKLTSAQAQSITFTSEYDRINWPVVMGVGGGMTGDDGQYKRIAIYHGNSISLQVGDNVPNINKSKLFVGATGVGVNTINPDGFQINSTLTQESSLGVNNVRIGNTDTPRIILDANGYVPVEMDNYSGAFRVFSPGNVKFQISANGNVGIGTTSPDSKLSVNGTIHSKEVKVDLNNWPDYVFKNDYVLPTLDQVKAYIDQNRHLPEIPSAAEVETDGVNLGEMNKLLLKKVEELTLYMIELKRLNEIQAANIENQSKELSLLKSKIK